MNRNEQVVGLVGVEVRTSPLEGICTNKGPSL